MASRKLTLHLYNHCPFCIRVQLVLGWARIPYDTKVWGYGDLSLKDHFGGKKMLPYLEHMDPTTGARDGLYESGDIIKWLAHTYGFEVRDGHDRFAEWRRSIQETQRILTRPRRIKMPDFDWSTDEDIEYAKNKYEKQGFDYEAAMASSSEHVKLMNERFVALDNLMDGKVGTGIISMDEVILVAELKGLTLVNDLRWPTKTKQYVTTGAAAANVALYFDHAI